MSTLIADLRCSFRSLLKNPGLTLAAAGRFFTAQDDVTPGSHPGVVR